MAAPTNSGEWDMATEDLFSNLSPLLSPAFSLLRSTVSPPPHFLPSSNQSMDDPPQNQEHEDIVDPALYLAGDSALLQQQQQLRQNWSEASDWRPREGIMRMNMLELQSKNQGFEESNMGFERIRGDDTCFYFSPSSSPTNFPLYRPLPRVFFVSTNERYISLSLSCQQLLEDKSGALHVINEEDLADISKLLFQDYDDFNFFSYMENKFDDLDQIVSEASVLPEDVETLVGNIMDADGDDKEVTLRRINWLEQKDEDNIDQPFFEAVGVIHQLIQNRDGELDVFLGGGVLTVNGLELVSDCQGPPTAPETLVICPAKLSIRVWLGHGGQWVGEIHYRCTRLNIGSFTTVEDAISAYEMIVRWSGRVDLTAFPGIFENENRSKLSPQLPPTAQELNLVDDFGLVCCNATWNDEIEAIGTGSEGTGDCVMAGQAWLNSGCLGKRKSMEKNPGGERRNKKTNGVRIVIPLELQTKGMRLKDAANHLEVTNAELMSSCQEYGIQRWPPYNEHKLIMQSLPDETPIVVDQEVIPQLTSHNVPSDQALMATVDTNSVVENEIPLTQFLLTAQQENLDVGFGNDEVEAIGMGGEGTGEGVMKEAQLNSWCSGKKGKRKVNTPGAERGNSKTIGVRIAIPKEDILRTMGMRLKDAAKQLEVGRSTLEHNLISCPNENRVVVDQERIPQLNSDTLPSDQALAATVGTNSVVVKEIPQPQFSLIDQQDNLDDDFGKDEVEAVGMVGEGTGEGKMEEGQLNSGCLGKGKNKEETSGGNRRNKKTNGFKIAISLDDILQAEGMLLKDAAKKFKVSRSTLKRVCRKYGIPNWPPSKGNEHICQSCPKETPAVVDQEGAQQLNCEILPSDRALATNVDTNSVVLKARWVDDIIVKIRLPKPWKMTELEQQVKKRLKLESGTYYIRYKDEENELITILCDEDLQEYISSSRPLNTSSIDVFFVPK